MSSEYSHQCPHLGYVDLCGSQLSCMEDVCIFLQKFVSNHNTLIHQQEGISTGTGMARMKTSNYLSVVIVVSYLQWVEMLVQLTEFFLVGCKCCQGVRKQVIVTTRKNQRNEGLSVLIELNKIVLVEKRLCKMYVKRICTIGRHQGVAQRRNKQCS